MAFVKYILWSGDNYLDGIASVGKRRDRGPLIGGSIVYIEVITVLTFLEPF